jgi:hypothetical protein
LLHQGLPTAICEAPKPPKHKAVGDWPSAQQIVGSVNLEIEWLHPMFFAEKRAFSLHFFGFELNDMRRGDYGRYVAAGEDRGGLNLSDN